MLLWGLKTVAAFDVWSFEHLANGIAMASAADMLLRKVFSGKGPKRIISLENITAKQQNLITFILVLVIALFWENAEHYIEAGVLPGIIGARITYWFQGVEHWSNRLLADNLMVMFGWYIYNKQTKSFWIARVFSTVWMLLHIFVFPHSMYLQELLAP